jgi:hypothetical protein
MERDLAIEDDTNGLERNEIELGDHCQGFWETRGAKIPVCVALYVEKV